MCACESCTCYRFKLTSFTIVAMDVPIEPNRKRGKPQKTAPALMRQLGDLVEEEDGIESDEESDEDAAGEAFNIESQEPATVTPPPPLQQNPDLEDKPKCTKSGEDMVKRRHWGCPNKCQKL